MTSDAGVEKGGFDKLGCVTLFKASCVFANVVVET